MTIDGSADMASAAGRLAARLPAPLGPLAALAYNYRWSWRPEVEDLFRRLDPERWRRCGENPARLLQEADPPVLARLAEDREFVLEVHLRARELEAYLRARESSGHPIAYFSAEFGVHRSLPFYAGGLGVLAGDLLKEASGRALGMVGVGLFYAEGSFHQHLDVSGWQHEYWQPSDTDRLPAVRVMDGDRPLQVTVRVRSREVAVRAWRVDAGATRLFLLDTDVPENTPADRWITSRLYIGNREVRLAQYAVLGIGGVRMLRAMGVAPRLVHLNEGHCALATLELLRERLATGEALPEAINHVRDSCVFTTHTPVAAGNESFGADEVEAVLPGLAADVGVSPESLAGLVDDVTGSGQSFAMTPLALRLAGRANGVSRLHGEVARAMWQGLWPGRDVADVPIAHITNGVHTQTWMAPEWQALFDRYLPGWRAWPPGDLRWQKLDEIPDEHLWAVRGTLRRKLAEIVRTRSVAERLGREERIAYAESAAAAWGDDTLTLGFARRIATYKRLYLVTSDAARAVRLLTGSPGLQIVIAGRAHPSDGPAKATVQQLFGLNDLEGVGGKAVFLEEYDLDLARHLVQGCDLWLNLPRRPHEASGTSGMKSAANGGLQLSVLDGWWAEAFRPGIGWGLASTGAESPEAQDHLDAGQFFELLEGEVLPLFYERDEAGIPRQWTRMMRESMRTLIPAFSAGRMVRDYSERLYAPGPGVPPAPGTP